MMPSSRRLCLDMAGRGEYSDATIVVKMNVGWVLATERDYGS